MSNKQFKPGEFCWNELMTSDVNKATSFYQQLLGWESEAADVGEITYTIFKSGDNGVAGMMQIPKGEEGNIPPHWMSYISVEDVDASAKQAEKLGAKIIVPPTTVSDYGRFVVMQDPTGAHISLWQALKACS